MENNKCLEFVKCNNCGQDNYQVLFAGTIIEKDNLSLKSVWQYTGTTNEYGLSHRIVKCRHCGLIYQNPRDAADFVIKNYQAVVDPDYLATEEERRDLFTVFIKEIESLSSPGTLLDIGCYAGLFLDIARSHGWNVAGVEPSQWAADYARSQGLNVVARTLQEGEFPDKKFELVTLWDVIEHLVDPKETLQEINRVTKLGGLLAVSTHNPESLVAKILGSRYPFFMRMHLYHFSPRLLKQMLQDAGFQVVLMKSNGRKFRLDYLLNRLGDSLIKKLLFKIVGILHLNNFKLRINLGDTYRLYAKKIRDV